MPDIITNIRIGIVGLENNRVDIFWSFINPLTALNFQIGIERGFALAGPFIKIGEVINSIHFSDIVAYPNEFRNPIYNLKVIDRNSNSIVQEIFGLSLDNKVDTLVKDMRLRLNVLLNEFTGIECLYYPKRVEGLRCHDCWDDISGHRMKSQCGTCFDTGYITGYYNPIFFRMMLSPTNLRLIQSSETDEQPLTSGSVIIPGHIPVNIGDLIVNRMNERFVIHSYDSTSKRHMVVHYNVRLHRLPKTDVRYKIPLQEEDFFLKLAPSREEDKRYTVWG